MIQEEMLKQRYYQDGECWEDLCRRVANTISQGDAGKGLEELFYDALVNKKFLPNSPTLMNAGINGTLSACFTLDVDDSMDSIMDTIKDMALISKSGGGCGCNWSKLRPAGSIVGSTNGVASGPVSFLELVNTMGDVVVQGGKRRVAIMSVLDVDHPDIKKFITVKTDSNKLNNMNMSVMIPDSFMIKVLDEDSKALEVWNLIIEQAHKTGEPGVLFYDTINLDNIFPDKPIRTTNPCGEEPMLPFSSCNLLSIDVSKLVVNDVFDWNEYKRLIKLAVAFADATIDVNDFPLEEIKKTTLEIRPLGLGIMGLANCFIKLGIVYGSNESYDFADKLTFTLWDEAYKSSCALARELGEFPSFMDSILEKPRRNGYLTSIAPTGSIATIAETSFSIEPIFSVGYTRKVLNQEFTVLDPLFEKMIKERGLNFDKISKLVVGKQSIQGIKEIPEDIRKLFITAHDLTPEQHIRMVSTIQANIDTGVSKTVNVPANFTIEETDKLFKTAYYSGCKGITIYRDGCREAPISVIKIEEDNRAPDVTIGVTRRIKTSCGHFHCTVSGIDDEPLKVFINATTRGCKANLEAIGRLCSLLLRSGVSKDLVLKQLSKIICDSCIRSEKAEVKSCADGVAQTIRLYSKGEIPNEIQMYDEVESNLVVCPECKQEYMANTKCGVCTNCGFSRCN